MEENIEMESDNKDRCGDLIIGSFDCVGDDISIINHIHSIHSKVCQDECRRLCSEIIYNGIDDANDSWMWITGNILKMLFCLIIKRTWTLLII